ncbi:hypothetical protein KM043_013248 [Ampulex compressa]|nr:hypothetical protein KM043_013248 [Ampulex compressa]
MELMRRSRDSNKTLEKENLRLRAEVGSLWEEAAALRKKATNVRDVRTRETPCAPNGEPSATTPTPPITARVAGQRPNRQTATGKRAAAIQPEMSPAVLLQQVTALMEGKLDLLKRELAGERRAPRVTSSALSSRVQSRSRRRNRKGVLKFVGGTNPAFMAQAVRTRGKSSVAPLSP